MSKPSDVDLSDNLLNKFGMSEFEYMFTDLVEWLAENGNSWEVDFRIDSIRVNHALFTMACNSWIRPVGIPKYCFVFTDDFVNRLTIKTRKDK